MQSTKWELCEYQRSRSVIDLGPNHLHSIFLNFFSSITADFNISSAIRWAIQDQWSSGCNIGIKHDFPFINIRKVPREMLKTEGEARGFQHLPRDLAPINEWQSHVWSLLLHKFKENTPKKWENVCALYFSALPPFSYTCTLFINILDSGRSQVLFLMMI